MPTARTRKQKRELLYQTFAFEIKSWEPSYSFSTHHDKRAADPYWEHIEIRIETSCLHPQHLAGREARFTLFGKRDMLDYEQYKAGWKPLCIGELDLPPSNGNFLAALPNDSLIALYPLLLAGAFKFILLDGPPLKRSRSLCNSFRLITEIDPDDL